MGLTGVILEATFGLKPIGSAYIDATLLKAATLAETLELFALHQHVSYSVAWMDCLSLRQIARAVCGDLGRPRRPGRTHPGQKAPTRRSRGYAEFCAESLYPARLQRAVLQPGQKKNERTGGCTMNRSFMRWMACATGTDCTASAGLPSTSWSCRKRPASKGSEPCWSGWPLLRTVALWRS